MRSLEAFVEFLDMSKTWLRANEQDTNNLFTKAVRIALDSVGTTLVRVISC